MLKNYIKTTFRSLKRSMSNTIINVLGLALGITSSLVMFLLYSHLMSYDKFQGNYDHIYRVVSESDGQAGNRDRTPGVPTPLPDALRNDFSELPEVLYITNLYNEKLVSVKENGELKTYYENTEDTRIAFTEQGYFTLFDFKVLNGNREQLLDVPNKVVLSERLAYKYFGEADPVNKTIIIDKSVEYIVSGVMQNAPDNTDFPFDMLLSYSTIKEKNLESGWGSVSSNNHCYVMLNPTQKASDISEKFPAFVKKYFDEENEDNLEIRLQPMSNFHFNTDYGNFSHRSVSSAESNAILIIALFLLATSCVNFINLSTAVAVKRAKEVGIRKVLGSNKKQLVMQFLSETLLVTCFAMVISMGLTELFLLYINPFLDINLDFSLFNNPDQFVFVLSLLLTITLLAGSYPAFVLSGFRPVLALKSKLSGRGLSGQGLRKGLVVFQFFISQVFIIGTIVLVSQLSYIKSADMGFDSGAVVSLGLPEEDDDKKKLLKTQLEQIAAVESVSLAFSNPASGSVSITNMYVADDPESYDVSIKMADENYLKIYDIKLLAGRGLPMKDTLSEMVVNEEFLRVTGIESAADAVGLQVKLWGKHVPIVGVMQNFHTVSLHDKIAPVALFNGIENYRIASVKINKQNLSSAISEIEPIWKSLYPDYNFDYEFVDVQIAEFYENEEKMSTIFTVFACIAIFIGCLGLYGLASYTVNQRVKEIGVRKVLGAKVSQILMLFSKEFFTLIVIAFVIAAPLGWYVMSAWLQDFEYRITIGPLIFGTAILTTLIIAVTTVGYKTTKAAIANPIDSLRDE